jgi:uncharacterized protein YjbI with pentapeptide repeats
MQIATIGALAFAGLPGLAALIALFFTYQQGHATDVQLQIAQQGQITDRYNAAITNLGSPSIEVRLGGIYALQPLMQDSSRDQPIVVAVLCAFVRDQTKSSVRSPMRLTSQLPTDIQAALTVIGTRNTANDGLTTVVDLDRAQLPNALLDALNLSGANINSADLTGASLTHADLSKADLTGANIADADLSKADLTGAYLSSANLTRTFLFGANLTDANLYGANLTKVGLVGAKIVGADFTDANLTGVFLSDQNLTDDNFLGANLTNANLDGANLHDADLAYATLRRAVTIIPAGLSPPGLPVTNLTGANLTHADLTGANLTHANLTGANLTGVDLTGAIWPKNIPVPKGWVQDPSSGQLRAQA